MKFFSKIFGLKNDPGAKELPVIRKDATAVTPVSGSVPVSRVSIRAQELLSMMDGLTHPTVAGNNFMEMFYTIPEVFWPINFIAKRISEAHFDIKRIKDDSIVWCDRRNLSSILTRPNPIVSWREFLLQHWIYKLATGNAFVKAAMPEGLTEDALKCVYCDHFWELPADLVRVEPVNTWSGVPLFGIAAKEDIIRGYHIEIGDKANEIIPPGNVWHDRDGIPELLSGSGWLKAKSRLMSVKKPIANLLAVSEARNVIFIKRGGLGFIVARKQDDTGTIALDPDEKKELVKEIDANYGITEGKSPYAVTDIPIDFLRTNLSIQELMPFDETLEDAIKIAGAFDIPAVLVPRKDQATFSNQESAEQSVYYATIIPAAKEFCQTLTKFLGLEEKGFYIDCDFSDVACLQAGRKDSETVKDMEFNRKLKEFSAGLCTLDDIRAVMHEDSKADSIPLFGKLKFEMTPDELAIVNNIIKTITSNGERNGQNNDKSGSGTAQEPSV